MFLDGYFPANSWQMGMDRCELPYQTAIAPLFHSETLGLSFVPAILRGNMRRRKKRLEKGKEARRRARKVGLAPSATRVIEDKRRKPQKHKRDPVREELDF
jgi:hypothetical protein